MNREKTQKIKQDCFSKLDDLTKLIAIFQEIYKDIQVREVWFLKKKNKGDGFEKWYTDYHNIKEGSVTARIGFSLDSDLHEKSLHRIGSRWCKNHVKSDLYVFVSIQFFFVFRSE